MLRATCSVGPHGKPCDSSSGEEKTNGQSQRCAVGTVTFEQQRTLPKSGSSKGVGGVAVVVKYDISGLAPGPHGLHVHEKADFSAGCASAGGHWNPHGKHHGDVADAPECHAGDLGNIIADATGRAVGSVVSPLLRLSGEHSIVGRSVMVHADEDDLGRGDHSEPGVNGKTSRTTGNAGARVACGEIVLVPATSSGEPEAATVVDGQSANGGGEKEDAKKRGWCCKCCFSLTTIGVLIFLVYVGFSAKTFIAIAIPGGLEGFTYQRNSRGVIVNSFKPYAHEGMLLDFEAYLSIDPSLSPRTFDTDGTKLVWRQDNVPWDFSNPDGYLVNTTLSAETVGQEMWDNLRSGNAYVHLFGREPSKTSASNVLIGAATPLVHDTVIARVIRKPQYRLLRPWLGDCGCGSDVSTVEAKDAAIILAKEVELASGPVVPTPHWKPNATFRMAVDFTEYPQDQVPGLAGRRMRLVRPGNRYLPILYHDDMWATSEKLLPLNDSVTELPLTVSLVPASFGRWQLGEQMGDALVLMEAAMGATDKEKDDVKRLITDTNPVLLVSIMLVSLLHLLFDTLAFKNDIQFWKNLERMDGLSGRAQTGSLVLQVVVLAYLHHEESSILVLAPAAFGVVVQAWKCVKVIRLVGFNKDTSTAEADEVAYQYLSKLLMPFVIGFAIFSCHCQTHEGWYSMILSTAVQTVYIMGFIVMTPQLFINYKKKSVAALPWRMLFYRTLNTFIDDLFAFVIKMPTMHRLSCFRDDIVFFIYLYQRWLYPVDASRPVLGVELDEAEAPKKSASASASEE